MAFPRPDQLCSLGMSAALVDELGIQVSVTPSTNTTSALGWQQNSNTIITTFGTGGNQPSTVIGNGAGANLPQLTDNFTVAIGWNALATISTAALENTAIGWSSMRFMTVGAHNTAVGVNTLGQETTGGNNVAVGTDALRDGVGNANTVAIGSATMRDTVGTAAIAIGTSALAGNSSGGSTAQNCIAIGAQSMSSTSLGTVTGNIGVGIASLQNLTSGNSNIAVGNTAAGNATSARQNVVIGDQAALGLTTGAVNIIIGAADTIGGENSVTTGNSNIVIGYNATVPSATAGNQMSIANVLYASGLYGTGAVGINVPSPAFTLDVAGTVHSTGAATHASLVVGSTGAPSVTSGSGAPGTTQPISSIYLRTDGSSGTRLYVSAGGGTWAAVAGV